MMVETTAMVGVRAGLSELASELACHDGFSRIVTALRRGETANLEGVWGGVRALVAAALADQAPGSLLIVCPHAAEIDLFCDDARLFTRHSMGRFPAWESEEDDQSLGDAIYADRLRLLKELSRKPAGSLPWPCDAAEWQGSSAGSNALPADAAVRLIVTSIQGLLQPVPSPQALDAATRTLRVGQEVDRDGLAGWLVQRGFHGTGAVEFPGEFSLRGGIVDIYAPDGLAPVRVEWFGEAIESLRRFDVASQRSLETIGSVSIAVAPLRSRLASDDAPHRDHLASYLPPTTWVLLIEPARLEEEGRQYRQRLDRPDATYTVADTFARLNPFPTVIAEPVSSGSFGTTVRLPIESVERFSGNVNRVRDELESAGAGQQVVIVCPTESESQRLGEILGPSQLAAEGRLQLSVGRLSAGFRLVNQRFVLVSSGELFQRADLARTARTRHRPVGRAIDSFLSLSPGDLVVHLAHGIGRFRGLKLLGEEAHREEHLQLEFHGGTTLYVPASKVDLVQKYVGGTKTRPPLARIGGTAWGRQKRAAEQAVNDLAAEMLELQAARAARPGIAFPDDSTWQREFDASFPYEETPDQISALEAIKHDMRQARPMDRLLCGDVGFGKTELAIRAAFKAVDAGYQVAVLVPTTILAEQHHRTFRNRMAEFPIEIATLSRFSSRREQIGVIRRLRDGAVDIVIGTHRLAGRDVAFHNLGLVIIDEEQRFGVAVKQRLKSYRATVDILTMTATPIPRTLHMSLMGVRSISNLETPPEDRLAVETRVLRWDEDPIRQAVLRELNREGQIYFVHNRVRDLRRVAARLATIVPEARLEIAHGQMPEGALEQVMLRFMDHQFDLLLATTIIESGLDIPNANTIFIDNADHYGLADLHQLRGRVGRYKHRAHAYLLIDPNRHVTPEAARRLRAIEEFSEMGAGFAIAMRDLELRGAGNILGTQQSGHIAQVGYELYCSLLEKAVRRVKALPIPAAIDVRVELPWQSYLPTDYVPDPRTRIDLYRRLTRTSKLEDLDELSREWIDRFGPLPEPAEGALWLGRLRIWAHRARIASIHLEPPYVVFGAGSREPLEQLAARSGGRLRVVDQQSAYLPVGEELRDVDRLRDRLESLLRQA